MNSKQIALIATIMMVAAATFMVIPSDSSDANVVPSEQITVTPQDGYLYIYVPAGDYTSVDITITSNDLIKSYHNNLIESTSGEQKLAIIGGFDYDETVSYTMSLAFNNGDTATKTFGAEIPAGETYTITWENYDGTILATSEVAEGETPVYNGVTPTREADSEYTYTFNGWEPAVVAATADATYTATYTETPVTPVDPDEDPAERPFTNTITLSDGAVIDASSSINASYTQEVVIAGDVTIAADGFLNIYGKLTIQDGAALTIEEGGNVIIQENGIVDVQGDLYAEAGAVGDESFQYGGCLMTVAGTVTLEGANSFATTSTAKGIEISGLFEVGDEATAVLNQTVVAEGGELLVYGVVTGIVDNAGTITVDSQGLADKTAVDMTVQLKATGTVDVTNVYGTITVSDSELTFTEKKEEVDADNNNTVTLSNVAGVTVTEKLVIEKNADDNKNHGINTMYITGGISVADDYNSTGGITGNISIDGDKVEIAEAVTLGEGVTMYVAGDLTVSGEVSALESAVTVDGVTLSQVYLMNGEITVTGKITTNGGILGEGVINAAYYETERTTSVPVYTVYTTLGTALADGATDIDLLGKNIVDADATIPVGTTVDMTVGSTLTVGKDVTLTIASDDRKSGKLNTATGAVDTVIVDGTMEIQNFAKSGVKIDAVLSDTSKEVESAMTFTNIYNALANAADGETVEVTRGAGDDLKLILEQNVEIRSGVTLLIPSYQIVLVDNGVTVTVDGTLVNLGTYDIADAIAEDKANDIKAKPAGATVVNGMFLTIDSSLYTEEIVGAYFGYTYEKKAIEAIAPLASLPAIADDITSEIIVLYGQMTLGAIDFSAYDGEGNLQKIVAQNDLTVESLTIGNLAFESPYCMVGMTVDGVEGMYNVTSVTGTIVLTNGTVELEGVFGITAQNVVDQVEDTVTSKIGGTVNAYDDPETADAEKGSVSVTGTVVADAIATSVYVAVDVPAGAELDVLDSEFLGAVTVEGTMGIDSTGTTFDVLTVTGTVTLGEDAVAATANALYVGVTAEDYSLAGTGSVSGVTLFNSKTSVAYVSPNATIAEDIVKNLKSTEYYAEDALYLTAYAYNGNTVAIDIPFTVDSAYFAGWQYEDKGKMTGIDKVNDMVGKYDAVYADIVYDIYYVTVTADAGIGTVAVDGIVLVNQGGNVLVLTTPIAAGQHTVSYTLKSGYQGEAKLTVSSEGVTVSGMDFTLSGNQDNQEEVLISLSLAGTEPGQTTVVVDNGGDSGMGLTDYLLIILVVLIVIMAIIVALRMMRS